MKDAPSVVQCNKRGQIVIPISIRERLGISEADFDLFSIDDRAIFLKIKKAGR